MKDTRTLQLISLSLIGLGIFFLPLLEATSFWVALFLGIILSFFVISQRRKSELIVVILFSLLMHAQWGVAQFSAQGDLNLRLLGETELSNEKVGIAKFGSEKTLRAYGPYTHANSFGGVMVIALALWIVANLRVVGLGQFNPLSLLIVFGIIVSFSRSALLALLLLMLIVLISKRFGYLSWIFAGLVTLIILVFTPLYIDRLGDPADMGVAERLSGYDWSLQIIKGNDLWRGVGFGSYKKTLKGQLDESGVDYNDWQIDYVHSIPLLGVAVIGVLPAVVLLIALLWLLHRRVSKFRLLVLVAIAPLFVFDHYLVTQFAPFLYMMLLIII